LINAIISFSESYRNKNQEGYEMGLISLLGNVISTARDSVVSEVQDQYIEVFKCDSLGQDVLVRKGATRIVKGNNKGNAEVISNGSIILVPEGTALLLVDNGEVIDFTTKAGRYQWDSTTSPSLLGDSHFLTNAKKVVADTWERMRAGGEITKQQRVYFVNLLEIRDQNFGTPKPIPYADPEYRNIYISMNGKFSFRIEDPVAFFKKVSSNIAGEYKVIDLMGKPADMLQPRVEFLDHLTEVVNRCGGVDKIMFANLPTEKTRLRNYMREALDEDWLQARGIVVDEVAIAVITPDDKSRERIEQVDQSKMFGADPNALAAAAVLGQTEAMNTAAGNSAGAVNGLMGMGMVGGMGQMGGGINSAFQFMGQQQQAQQMQPQMQPQQMQGAGVAMGGAAVVAGGAPAANTWTCPQCGKSDNTANFCGNCGTKKPEPKPAADTWTCPQCGKADNTANFCGNCGTKRPEAGPSTWTCPQCGKSDNTGNFCGDCGTKKP